MEKLNKDADMCYLGWMASNRAIPLNISKQDKARLGRLGYLFDGMATKEEKDKLLPSQGGVRVQAELGERRAIVGALSELMRARYAAQFAEYTAVPAALASGKDFMTSTVENRDRSLKAVDREIDVRERDAMPAWRKAYTPPARAPALKRQKKGGLGLSILQFWLWCTLAYNGPLRCLYKYVIYIIYIKPGGPKRCKFWRSLRDFSTSHF